jgi:hypothetical protein
MPAPDLWQLILGGGLAGLVYAAIRFMQSLRTYRKGTLGDLEEWRAHANDARQLAERERDAWRAWAGRLEYTCEKNGIALPPRPPELTSMMTGELEQ